MSADVRTKFFHYFSPQMYCYFYSCSSFQFEFFFLLLFLFLRATNLIDFHIKTCSHVCIHCTYNWSCLKIEISKFQLLWKIIERWSSIWKYGEKEKTWINIKFCNISMMKNWTQSHRNDDWIAWKIPSKKFKIAFTS